MGRLAGVVRVRGVYAAVFLFFLAVLTLPSTAAWVNCPAGGAQCPGQWDVCCFNSYCQGDMNWDSSDCGECGNVCPSAGSTDCIGTTLRTYTGSCNMGDCSYSSYNCDGGTGRICISGGCDCPSGTAWSVGEGACLTIRSTSVSAPSSAEPGEAFSLGCTVYPSQASVWPSGSASGGCSWAGWSGNTA